MEKYTSSTQTREERRRRNPTGFSPCEVYETTVLSVFSAWVPHHTWFTYNSLTDSETNMSRCYRITKEGSIPRCQSLPFHLRLIGRHQILSSKSPTRKQDNIVKKTQANNKKTPTARCQRLLRDRRANNNLGNS